MSEYGEMCRAIKDKRQEVRAKHGVACPECVAKLPKANPSILLPQQRCKIHNYKDPRERTAETSVLTYVG